MLLIPRWVKAKRVTFKYGLGDEFINVLKVLHKLGLDRTEPVTRQGGAGLAARRRGGLPARPGGPRRPDARQDLRRDLGHGHGQGRPAAAGLPLPRGGQRLVHGSEYGSQAVVWQTAINPVVAFELLARGTWSGAGVLGPEAFEPGRSWTC